MGEIDMNKLLKDKNALGTVLTLIGGAFWGLSGSCGQFLFENKGFVSQTLVPLRLFTAGIILLIVCAVRYKGKIFDVFKNKCDALDQIIFGVVGLMMCQFTYFYTIQYSNAGTATVLQYTNPVMIMAVTCIIKKQAPHLNEIIAVVLALSGTFLIATHGSFTSLAISPKALIVGLLSACTCVIYSMQPKRIMNKYNPAVVTGWGMLIGGVVLSLIFRPWNYEFTLDKGSITAFSAIVILGTVCSFTFYLTGVTMIGAVKASLFASVEPLSAAVISALWLKTKFYPVDLIGFALILSTLFILTLTGKKKEGKAHGVS